MIALSYLNQHQTVIISQLFSINHTQKLNSIPVAPLTNMA